MDKKKYAELKHNERLKSYEQNKFKRRVKVNIKETSEDFEEAEESKDEVDIDEIDTKLANTNPTYACILNLVEQLKTKYPQLSIDGERNIWIVKPAGSSRGRGIALFKNLVEILALIKQKEGHYLAQKYIENTLIVKNRKFDIR